MLHHVLVKWKERPVNPAQLNRQIESLFQGVLTVPGVHGVEVIPNVVDRPNRYDLMIRIDMDADALPAYDACETHHRWKNEYGALIEKKAIFDCD